MSETRSFLVEKSFLILSFLLFYERNFLRSELFPLLKVRNFFPLTLFFIQNVGATEPLLIVGKLFDCAPSRCQVSTNVELPWEMNPLFWFRMSSNFFDSI